MNISGWMQKSDIPLSLKRDAILLPVLFFFNFFSFSSWHQLGEVTAKPWLLFVWLYGLISLVPLAGRNRMPLTVLATQWLFTAAAWPILPQYFPMVGIPVALYAVSVHCRKKISALALLISFIPSGLEAAVVFRVYSTPGERISSFIANAVFLTVLTMGAWASGCFTQINRQRLEQLERERATTWEAVAEERRRIARELHDIVSHAVTIMVLQAAGAKEVADFDFAQVKKSLVNIEDVGKQAMTELRRLLGVLEASNATDYAAGIRRKLELQPRLADLPTLLVSLKATGAQITDQIEGTPRSLDPNVDLIAYRIVQEGLTNVLKHAGKDASPHLRLVWNSGSLFIEINNCASRVREPVERMLSLGRGLTGLHERAQEVGGFLHAGPSGEGGYRLTATLPIPLPPTSSEVSFVTVLRTFHHGRKG